MTLLFNKGNEKKNLSQDEILDNARNASLTISEITYGMNGYPKGLGNYAVTGFDSFEDAEKFAEENGCEINLFEKRNGHQFFTTKGWTNRPLTSDDYLSDLGDNYSEISESDIEFYKQEAIDALEADDFQKAKDMIAFVEEIQSELNDLSDDEVLIKGDSFETVKKVMMQYHEDVTLYSVGVFVPYTSQENEEENE